MQEITTQGVRFNSVSGNNAVIKRQGKTITLQSNEAYDYSNNNSRELIDGDTVIIGAKTFVTISDSTKYPDPYTMMAVLANSEFKISIKPWDFTNKAKEEHESGFKITGIELIKGIFNISTGAEIKARNASFIFPKRKGNVKIEITSNAMYIGGTEGNVIGPFTNKPLNLTQFGEYIIIGNRFYKKSMLAMNEENRMDERFMALDMLFMKINQSAMSMSDKTLDTMGKSIESFNPSDLSKGLETAMNMTPEMLKQMGIPDSQLKQMTEGLSKFKKEMTPDKMSMFKEALGKVKKEDIINTSKSIKTLAKSAPKSSDLITDFESLVPYGPLPGKAGECEEAEV